MVVCIVGKSGSGKTYICELLKSYSVNIVHLDIDIISHKILLDPNVINELVNTFGHSVLSNGTIDRKTLSKIVFSSESEMEKLTEITWNRMEPLIDEYINNNKNKIILLDWQLLPKTKYFESCDLKILVNASFEERMKKTISRDNINKTDFLIRDKASYNFDNLQFDYIINNDYSKNVERIVREIYDKSFISR